MHSDLPSYMMTARTTLIGMIAPWTHSVVFASPITKKWRQWAATASHFERFCRHATLRATRPVLPSHTGPVSSRLRSPTRMETSCTDTATIMYYARVGRGRVLCGQVQQTWFYYIATHRYWYLGYWLLSTSSGRRWTTVK